MVRVNYDCLLISGCYFWRVPLDLRQGENSMSPNLKLVWRAPLTRDPSPANSTTNTDTQYRHSYVMGNIIFGLSIKEEKNFHK